MNRKLSFVALLIVAVFALTAFAACSNGLDDYSLTTLAEAMDAQFTKATGSTYTLDTSVSFLDESNNNVTAKIKWSIEDGNGVTVTEGAKGATVTVPSTLTSGSYILVGALVNDKNEILTKSDGTQCVVRHPITIGSSNQGNTGGDSTGGNTGGNTGGSTTTPSGDKGTQNNPYTVTEALALVNGLSDNAYSSSAVYVKGVVSGSVTKSSQTENTYNFDLVDATGDTDHLIIWWALSTSAAPVAGQNAVIYGYLQKYVDKNNAVKPEMGSKDSVTLAVISLEGGSNTGGGSDTPTPTPDTDVGTLAATINMTGNSALKTSGASQAVYENSGITVTVDKATCTSDFSNVMQAEYEQRFYQNVTAKIDYTAAIQKIVFTTGKYNKVTESSHLTANVSGITVVVSVDSNGEGTVTVVFAEPVTSATFTLGKQMRVAKIEVYTA